MGLLRQILILFSHIGHKPKDTYEPEFDGQFINKGNQDNEKWVWVDKCPSYPSPVYVVVFKSRSDYRIVVSPEPVSFALESIDCPDKRSVQITIEYLQAYYGVLGKVSIDTGDIV